MPEQTAKRRTSWRDSLFSAKTTENVGLGAPGVFRATPGELLRLWVALLLCFSQLQVCANGEVKVKVLSLMFNPTSSTADSINSLNAGFNASLAAQNWTVVPGVGITVIRPPSYDISVLEYLEGYLKTSDKEDEMLVVFGPMGEKSVIGSYKLLEKHNVVGFAPLTELAESRKFLPNLYFLRPEPGAELIALIRYAINYMRVRRLGFAYSTDVAGSVARYYRAEELMSQMGYEFCCVLNLKGGEGGGPSSDLSEEMWEEFARDLPQAVIMFARVNEVTKRFVGKLVSDVRTASASLLAPSLLQKSLVDVWQEALEAANATFVPHRLIQTGTNPLAKTTYFRAIERFQGEAKDYLTRHQDWSGLGNPNHFLEDDADGELMVYGWIAAEVLMSALRSNTRFGDRVSFLKSLYDQRRYVVDDLVIGDFGGECVGGADVQGAVCACNRGGKKVFMKEVVEGYRFQHITSGMLSTDRDHCYATTFQLQPPLGGVIMSIEDNPTMLRASEDFFIGSSSAAPSLKTGDVNRVIVLQVATATQEAMEDLFNLQENRIVTAVFGVVTEAMLDVQSLTFIDPIILVPRLNKFRDNVIHLSPTLEQQLYVLVSYLSTVRNGLVSSFICSREGVEVAHVLRKTLRTFGLNLSSNQIFRNASVLKESLPTSGDVFLLGLSSGDVAMIEEYLRNHEGVRVFVQFSEVMVLYNEFVKIFNKSPGSSRLVFATSLPHWADPNTHSRTIERFHGAVGSTYWNPLALLGFVTEQLMQRNIRRMDKITPRLLADVFFNEASITVDDMRYGTYDKESCQITGISHAADCIANFGATNISVWSMARVLDPRVPMLKNPATPSMIYADPNVSGFDSAQLAGIIVGSVFSFLLFLFVAVPLYFVTRSGRDNDNAPKQPSEPVTIIFTDIEGSTAQWAAHPELMPDAVATHHRIIRGLIAQYGCYEVKTVGDSFMIACHSPSAAILIAHDLQVQFLRRNWGTTLFDESYRQFEEHRVEEEGDYVPPTAQLDPEVYCQLWNGLRVRIGIHTGLCDIRHDEVTKGYDYYGRTSNMAARTESVTNGGQVLLTRSTYLSLSTEERERLDVTSLGPVALRGVPCPVEMYQLNAVPGRKFAELRLDRDVDVLKDGTEGSILSTSDHSSTIMELSESSQLIVSSLNALLGAFARTQRQKVLISFCERWRVVLPRKAPAIWDDAYCHEVIRRIAMKVGHVVDYCASSDHGNSLSTVTSASVIIIPQPRPISS